jgi:hypothetical protein
MTEDARKQAESALSDAKAQGEAMMKDALEGVDKEIAVLAAKCKSQ